MYNTPKFTKSKRAHLLWWLTCLGAHATIDVWVQVLVRVSLPPRCTWTKRTNKQLEIFFPTLLIAPFRTSNSHIGTSIMLHDYHMESVEVEGAKSSTPPKKGIHYMVTLMSWQNSNPNMQVSFPTHDGIWVKEPTTYWRSIFPPLLLLTT